MEALVQEHVQHSKKRESNCIPVHLEMQITASGHFLPESFNMIQRRPAPIITMKKESNAEDIAAKRIKTDVQETANDTLF